MDLPFMTVDVFTKTPFGGNPLAVVLESEGLDQQTMQRIAGEFNLAETTFVLPPQDSSHTAEVRIFTPRHELPFAGHPNIGTAFVLASRGESTARAPRERLLFEEKVGLVEVDLLTKGSAVTGARLRAPRIPQRGEEIPSKLVGEACSLPVDVFETRNHPPLVVSSGIPFVMAELKSLEALAVATPRTDVFAKELPSERAIGVLLYVSVDRPDADIRCRMFAPLQGVFEDPATGSANVALIGLLASLESEPDLKLTKTIVQGVEMGRPSVLEAEAEKRDGGITGAWIGGSCVAMMQGTLSLPG
ncbi:MAG TPA: PhzF family phenazine biosynthesis protein [Vicinamibacteria bacterium]|nr:PhzF family phenazine biosynthesis protein [Vicinamibacteria bacterium]